MADAEVDADFERQFVDLLGVLDELQGQERRTALLDFARSEWFSPCGLLLEGRQGAVHQEAWQILSAELAKDTPAKRWHDSDWRAGRRTIIRLLGQEEQPFSIYNTLPFRTCWTQEDEPWIAAAVGCEPVLASAERSLRWMHLDITDVILWNPRTNEARLADDPPGQRSLVLPYIQPYERMTVWADPAAYFRAWASGRGEVARLFKMQQQGAWVHPVTEDPDGGLPGALAIGGVDHQPWTRCRAGTLFAAPGLDRRALRRAVIASANLPNVEDAGGEAV